MGGIGFGDIFLGSRTAQKLNHIGHHLKLVSFLPAFRFPGLKIKATVNKNLAAFTQVLGAVRFPSKRTLLKLAIIHQLQSFWLYSPLWPHHLGRHFCPLPQFHGP